MSKLDTFSVDAEYRFAFAPAKALAFQNTGLKMVIGPGADEPPIERGDWEA
jgi:hypothetical protein